MSTSTVRKNQDYGFNNPLQDVVPLPILARRAPIATDIRYPIGQQWINTAANTVYYLTSVVAGAATWTVNAIGASLTVATSLTAGTTVASGTTITAGTSLGVTTTAVIGTGLTVTTGNATLSNGNLVFGTAGNKILSTSVAAVAAAGANSFGLVTLVGGTVTVTTTAVTAASLIYIWRQTVGATGAAATGNLSVGTITAGVSFVINAWSATDATALQASDVSRIGWMIVN